MTTPCVFLSPEEFDARETQRRTQKLTFLEAFGPGAMWFCPWYHDPSDPADIANMEQGGTSILSVHYWRDWARIRPPITVLCPNGRHWCVDQGSSNGTGWMVTGTVPNITCQPSIVVPGYHGWLRDGVFSDDIEGRGPNGSII